MTEKVKEFHNKFARSFLSYPHLLEAVYGLGDKMFDAYSLLSDQEKLDVCAMAAQIVCMRLGLNQEAQQDDVCGKWEGGAPLFYYKGKPENKLSQKEEEELNRIFRQKAAGIL